MEHSRFTPAYVVDEKLKMKPFKVGLNPGIKKKMSVRHYTLYKDMYDTEVNVKRAMFVLE